jgi:hypothetical protein
MKKLDHLPCIGNESCRLSNNSELCAACIEYVNQDYVPQRESPLPTDKIDKIDPTTLPLNLKENAEKPSSIPNFVELLEEAKLTAAQKRVAILFFVDGKSFAEIGESLSISKACAYEHYERAITKAKKHLTNSAWVRNLDFKSSPAFNCTSQSKRLPRTRALDPFQYYSACPECLNADLQSNEAVGTCFACGWAFSVSDQ